MASRELKEKSKQMFTEMEQGLKKMHPPKEDSMFYYHPSSHALFWNMSQTLKGRIRQMLC